MKQKNNFINSGFEFEKLKVEDLGKENENLRN